MSKTNNVEVGPHLFAYLQDIIIEWKKEDLGAFGKAIIKETEEFVESVKTETNRELEKTAIHLGVFGDDDE